MQRRTWLGLGLVGGAAFGLAAVGVGFGLGRHGRQAGAGDEPLTATGREIMATVARAVLEGSLPQRGEPGHAPALAAHLQRVDATLGSFPPATQSEVAELLTLLAVAPTRWALTGLSSDWVEASDAEVRAMLRSLQTSRLAMRRQIFHGLRDITNAAYFAEPATWARIGYPGPAPL